MKCPRCTNPYPIKKFPNGKHLCLMCGWDEDIKEVKK